MVVELLVEVDEDVPLEGFVVDLLPFKGLSVRIFLNSSGVKSAYSLMPIAYPSLVALCFLMMSQFLAN